MRRFILLGLVGLSVGAAAPVPTKATKLPPHRAAVHPAPAALPVFSFLGDDTETATARTTLNAAKCGVKGDITSCTDYSDPSIAGTTLEWLSMSYNRGLLYEVMGAVHTNSYDTILAAFTAKYGNPKVEVRKWQAKSGATFDNTVAVWKFRGGDLQLESLGPDLNTSLFVFSSGANSPPEEKPKVDF